MQSSEHRNWHVLCFKMPIALKISFSDFMLLFGFPLMFLAAGWRCNCVFVHEYLACPYSDQELLLSGLSLHEVICLCVLTFSLLSLFRQVQVSSSASRLHPSVYVCVRLCTSVYLPQMFWKPYEIPLLSMCLCVPSIVARQRSFCVCQCVSPSRHNSNVSSVLLVVSNESKRPVSYNVIVNRCITLQQ
jgi:hypothetical protein